MEIVRCAQYQLQSHCVKLRIYGCRSLSVPVAMRAIIRHSQGRRGAEEAFAPNSNGLAPTTAALNGAGAMMASQLRVQNGGGRAIKTEESEKGGGGGGGGDGGGRGGGAEVKTEPMEFEFSGRNTLVVSNRLIICFLILHISSAFVGISISGDGISSLSSRQTRLL